MRQRGRKVDLGAITDVPILAIEGERDDISGVGQTKAALTLTPSLPEPMKAYHLAKGAGHYGIFNGSRRRAKIAPIIEVWMARFDRDRTRVVWGTIVSVRVHMVCHRII